MTRLPTVAALAATCVLAGCKAETRGDVAAGSGPSASATASASVGGEAVSAGASAGGSTSAAPATLDSTGAPVPAAPSALVDPNSASREQLAALPGMSTAAADALANGRPYANMLEVDSALQKAGIAEPQRKALYAQLWKPLDLNSAKPEEILLVPGVGKRMQHEFEEYRPYKTMAQFRREIGKYVNEQEVDRLAKYVTVRGAEQ